MRGESSALEGVADLVPPEHVSDELRSSIDKLSEHLDGLLFLDHTAELAVDRSAFLALCRDEQLLPAEIRDIFILETAKYCGRRLKEFETKGRRLRWREAEKYGLVGHAGVDELAERGYKPTMSQEDIEAAIGDWYPTWCRARRSNT